MRAETTRRQIVQAADALFYQNGFEHTSFADIAAAVQLSRGNFYYHFKSKDEILNAVIALRLENTARMLEDWAAETANPADRIRSFIDILLMNRAKIMRFGCPVGTLCNELAKLEHVAQGRANSIFTLFRTWLARQFTELGHKAQADHLAMHVLMHSQGVATLANAFRDEAFIRREVAQINAWLDGLAKPKTRKASR